MARRLAPAALCLLPFVPVLAASGSTPQDQIVLPVGDGLTVGEVLEVAQQALDIDAFQLSDPMIRELPVNFTGTLTLAPQELLGLLETTLALHDVVHAEVDRGSRTAHLLLRATPQNGGSVRNFARRIAIEDLEQYADRGLLVSVCYEVQNVNARDVVNTLQPFFLNSSTQLVRNVEGTNSIVMAGPAQGLWEVYQLLQDLDRPVEGLSRSPIDLSALNARVSALEQSVTRLKNAVGQR